MGTPPTDEELMDRVQQGDASAYTTLFERHRAPLYGYALRMVRSAETADDVFQEAFLSVHRARHTWSSRDGSFRSWLYRITTNIVRDRLRRQARRPEVLTDTVERTHHDHPVDRLRLEAALDALPDHLRDAFLLGVVEGLDHHELARALDITPDNARARLSRARQRLRELLEEA